jgi:formylmethanofuran--tetrahydromethanopterin N-formyltransferase
VWIGPTLVVDTFAEAFRLRYTRILVTAHDSHWLEAGLRATCGYGTSVLGCDAEIGVEGLLSPDDSPDGRPGASILAFSFAADGVAKAIANRTAQCLLTCPTIAVFDGLPRADERAPLGNHVRYFGDGFEKTKVVDGRRYWRVPVMDGEFLIEETCGIEKGVGGGNFILQGTTLDGTLAAVALALRKAPLPRRRLDEQALDHEAAAAHDDDARAGRRWLRSAQHHRRELPGREGTARGAGTDSQRT